LCDGGKKSGMRVEPVRTATERGCEIKAKSVDVILLDPVPQRIHDHLQHARMGQVE